MPRQAAAYSPFAALRSVVVSRPRRTGQRRSVTLPLFSNHCPLPQRTRKYQP